MSSPFVKINDGKLKLFHLDIPDCEIRVICILGKARMGKSTFLNTMVTHLEGIQPFQTQNDDEHCTRGMDYYFCKEERIVLMDCQGLALEDSSHDPALLLFAYLISDIIIFNERMMLQNEALKLLEPVCTFMPYLDMKEPKPELYFRISDGDMVTDIQKNLDKVVHTQYKDQYQSIRDSLVNLFSDIRMVKTDTFDKQTKLKLQKGDYASLLAEELGFNDSIHTILKSLPVGISSTQWKENIAQYILQINQNEKISIEKLDVVGQSGKIDILEWISSVKIPACPVVDGTQTSYKENVHPMIKYKKNIMSEFTRKFKAIPESVKHSHYQKLSESLLAPIKLAELKCEECAEIIIKPYVENAQKDQNFPNIFTHEGSITNRPISFFHEYLRVLDVLEEKCMELYLPIQTKYKNWINEQVSIFEREIDNLKSIEHGYVLNMKKCKKETLSGFMKSLLQHIREFDVSILNKKKKDLLSEYCMIETIEQDKKLIHICKPHCLQVWMKDKKMKCKIVQWADLPGATFMTKSYDLIQPESDSFTNCICSIMENKEIEDAITDRKNELLKGTLLTLEVMVKLEEVSLVSFPLFDSRITMTEDTFEHTYKIILLRTRDALLKKKYILLNTDLLVSAKNDDQNLLEIYSMNPEPHIAYLYKHQFAKELAKACVNGFIVPN